jgi:hypothetical protein
VTTEQLPRLENPGYPRTSMKARAVLVAFVVGVLIISHGIAYTAGTARYIPWLQCRNTATNYLEVSFCDTLYDIGSWDR